MSARQLADDLRFRTEFGFRSDPPYVQALYQRLASGDLRGSSRTWGALLAASETADMLARQRVAEAVAGPYVRSPSATPFQAYIARSGAEFGGLYIDQQADGTAVVLFTGHLAQHRRELAGVFPYPEHLRVDAVRSSWWELLSVRDAVKEKLSALSAAGVVVNSFGPDARTNSVDVRVTTPDATAITVVHSILGSAPITLVAGGISTAMGGHVTDAPPARGGQWITRCTDIICFGEVECTTAFVVQSGSNYFAATAGHCGSVGDTWVQGDASTFGQTLGNATAVQYGPNNNDAAVIRLPSSFRSSQIFIQQVSCGFLCTENNYRNVGSEEQVPVLGEVACLAGSTSDGEHCANITNSDQCLNESDGNGNLTMLCHQAFVLNYTAMPGDSGGSWYQPETTGTSMAQGIESGAFQNNGGSNFTEISPALSLLGGYSVTIG